MNINKTILRTYRFSEFEVYKLDKLKQYGLKESNFIRKAIEEKLERDLPKLYKEKQKDYCPF